MSDTILITGGLGYLGSRISIFLSKKNEFLVRLTSTRSSVKRPIWLKRGEVVKFDLLSDSGYESICKGVRYVIHLAANNAEESSLNPERAVKTNVLGTFKLLRAAQEAGVERFIYFSTAHVYGNPLCGRITEKTITRPVHPYAITHRAAEDFVLSSYNRKGLTGIVIRLSNAIGVPIDAGVNCWSLIANDLCRQAVTTKKLILKTSGLQSRDFITIKNVSYAVLHILSLSEDICRNKIFNLGSGKSMLVIDLAKFIRKRCQANLGFCPEIVISKTATYEKSLRLDYRIDKIRSTGFYPVDNFTEEIDDTLIFCQRAFGTK